MSEDADINKPSARFFGNELGITIDHDVCGNTTNDGTVDKDIDNVLIKPYFARPY